MHEVSTKNLWESRWIFIFGCHVHVKVATRGKSRKAFVSQSFRKGAQINGANKINGFLLLKMLGCCGLWWWDWDNQCGIGILQQQAIDNV
jgi:hypothetical protein